MAEKSSISHASMAATEPSFVSSKTSASMASVGGETASKTHRASYSFMQNREMYRVIVDGFDYTPDNIVDPSYVTMEAVFTHAAFETKHLKKKEKSMLKDVSKSQTGDMGMKVYATTINLDDIHIDHTINTEEGYPPEDVDLLEEAPSAYYLPKEKELMSYPPTFSVALKETETVYLFSMPTYSYEKGTQDGNLAEEENTYYTYITVGKGRNRKMVNQETQTRQTVTQTRHTMATRPKKKNASAFASVWDMHDTYAQLAKEEEIEEEDEMVMYQSAAAYLLRKKRLKRAAKHKNRTFEEIGKIPQFFDAALLVERVLASKDYSDAQKSFRGLVNVDPLSLDLVYIYTMKPLWSFEAEEAAGRPITSIAFNPKNPDILAVAHGKLAFADNFDGILCVWCTKNPCKPERLYRFPTPLTSVGFSMKNPNWLSVGFANGDVCILDITSYFVKTIAISKRDTNPCFEPIWVTKWCKLEVRGEYVMTACQDGRINRFTSTKTHDFICTPMMRISTVEGKMKGLEATKGCLKVDVPITRYPAALCIQWHPAVSHQYLVGTDEGCIHKCSTHYLNQHIDVFKAHSGPVYAMEYSPFMTTLLVSCGADNAIRLWIEGVDDVIMTLTCPSAVYGVAFCPINATILLSASGNALSVWDLRRKTHAPCAEHTFHHNVTLTYIKFSASGENVFVGDSAGRVHTFHLEDTPIPPYYQRKMLDEAIKRALCTRPNLLKQLEKLEKFRDKFSK